MPRFKTIAGYFQEVIEKQPIKIMQNQVKRNEAGSVEFDETGKPIMISVEVDAEVDVKNVIWNDQVNIQFTQEEEDARDAEEAVWENEKSKPIPLTAEQEIDLLLESGPEAVKQKRNEYKELLSRWEETHLPLVQVMESKKTILENSIIS